MEDDPSENFGRRSARPTRFIVLKVQIRQAERLPYNLRGGNPSVARPAINSAGVNDLRNRHFFPDAAFLLPVVERFAVDFVNGSFRDAQFAGLYHHKEIDVVDFSVPALHIDTGEVFVSAETRKPVIVEFDQVQREIFTLIWHVKFLVGGFRSVAADESL